LACTAKQILGIVITLLSLALLFYELFYVNIVFGKIGVKDAINIDAILLSAGFLLILLGPWLWLGEVPVAIKKMIEARTGRKVG
jgi:hypothetical protein